MVTSGRNSAANAVDGAVIKIPSHEPSTELAQQTRFCDTKKFLCREHFPLCTNKLNTGQCARRSTRGHPRIMPARRVSPPAWKEIFGSTLSQQAR
jgi:hypothetical protein